MATETQTCYRHSNRETRVQCSACGRPICPDCMTPTPVGMRCPECAKQKTEVRNLSSTAGGAVGQVTITLLIINVIAFIASGEFSPGGQSGSVNELYQNGVLVARGTFDGVDLIGVAEGQPWRLVSYGFLHSGILHIAFNMYLLYLLGQELESSLGPRRFALLYLAGLLGGAGGALLVEPDAATVGASGAVFGLMGFIFLTLQSRGINPFQTFIGPLLAFNLVLGFIIPNVSVGGHLGGLAGGAAAAALLLAAERSRGSKWLPDAALAGTCAVLGVAAFLIAQSAA